MEGGRCAVWGTVGGGGQRSGGWQAVGQDSGTVAEGRPISPLFSASRSLPHLLFPWFEFFCPLHPLHVIFSSASATRHKSWPWSVEAGGGPAAGWPGATDGQSLVGTGPLGRIWCWGRWEGDSQLACDTPHPFWGLPSFQGTGPAPSHRAPARQPRRAPESLAHLPPQASEQLPLLPTPWGFARPSGLLLLCTWAHLGPWEPQDHRSWLIHQRRRMPARPEPCHPCT